MAQQGGSSALVAKAMTNICKADDVRKETEMMMKPYANWEEYLMPGPLSIAILGELACIAAGQGDFSINKTPPDGGFKYIKYPDSFLTSLTQLSHAGWSAFNTAHKNMDQIRLLSMSVPGHMKTIVQTLFQDVQVVDALLPGQLNNMKSIAHDCTELAKSVENKFTDVIDLIKELLTACLSSKTQYEKELEETKRALEDAELRRKAAEEAKAMAEKHYMRMNKKVDETFADYKEAMANFPTGWNALSMTVVGGLFNAMNTVPNAISSFVSALTKENPGTSNCSDTDADNETEDDPISVSNIYSKSEQLTALATALQQLVDDEDNINANAPSNERDQKRKPSGTKRKAEQLQKKTKKEKHCSVQDEELDIRLRKSNPKKSNRSDADADNTMEDDPISVNNICSKSEQLPCLATALGEPIDDVEDRKLKQFWIKQRAKQLQQKIREEDYCSVTDEALKICRTVITVCQALDAAAQSGKKVSDQKSLMKNINKLWHKVHVFDTKSKSRNKVPPFSQKTPNMAKYQQNEGAENPGIKSARIKLEQSREMLKATEDQYQTSFEILKKQNMELTEILITMRKCETKEIDFEEARKMLIKGLDALGRVKEQWEKMVHFFQMISSLIESCLSRRIIEFVQSAEDVQEIPNYSCKSFVTDLIYKQAFNASNVAHLVHMISETYTEVSSKYLMDCVSSLGRLISMDPSNPRLKAERMKLATGCDEARKAIEDLVVKKKKEFEYNLQGRVEKISHELKSVLPPATEEEQKVICDTVQQGMRELAPEEENQFV